MSFQTANVSLPTGESIFYRHAGSPQNPVVLLLHGFPSSSHQYRHLIPILALTHYVIAPDLPGFGFTTAPNNYVYTFANLANTVMSFLNQLKVHKYALYIFDYGAPTGLRLALQRPHEVTAIVSQNGNAYVDGLTSFWEPVKEFWKNDTPEIREQLSKALLTFDGTKMQYETGSPKGAMVEPEAYWLDWALLEREGNKNIQLDLFKDYQTNVELYPKFQEYFRKSGVPVLAAWGKNDPIFGPAGAEAFKRDAKNAEVVLLDAGHFALETNLKEIANLVQKFLKRVRA